MNVLSRTRPDTRDIALVLAQVIRRRAAGGRRGGGGGMLCRRWPLARRACLHLADPDGERRCRRSRRRSRRLWRAPSPATSTFPPAARSRVASAAPAPTASRRSSSSRPRSAAPTAWSAWSRRRGAWRAWTVVTTLEELHGYPDGRPRAVSDAEKYSRDFGGENWLDQRRKALSLRRSRSDRADRGRRPGRPVGGGAPQPSRRRHADRRSQPAHRRQLAPALSLAHPAQRGARQPPAVDAVPADLAGVHPQGQARQLVRDLCREPRAQLLDGHRAGRRPLGRQGGPLDGDAASAATAASAP